MRGRQRITACSVPVALAWLALSAPALGRTFEVNRTNDAVPDGCTRSECTLREAILAANVRPGPDTVVLRSGRRYGLIQPGADEDLGLTGDLDVTDPLTLTTDGRRLATIDANDLDRVLDLRARARLVRLGITGGLLTTTGSRGAGVAAVGAPVRLVRSVVRGNHGDGSAIAAGGLYAPDGGAIKRSRIANNETTGNSGGLWVAGELDTPFVISRSRILGNRAVGSFPGGGLITEATVTRTRIAGNRAATGCGGIGAGSDFPFGEGVRFVRSVIERNIAETGVGGGICSSGVGADVALIRSVVRRNESGLGGGLSVVSGAGLIVKSTIARNTAAGDGGGVLASVAQPLAIRGSTISDNSAGGTGGGIRAETATELNLTNSTVAGNEAGTDGGGIFAINPSGGNETLVTLTFTTVARNVADADGNLSGVGGGIASGTDASYVARGSLVGKNVGNDPDCFAVVDSQGRNLISVETGACNAFDGPGDLVGNPRLGRLGRNDGPTATIPLKRRSRAIDAGGSECPARDQRGMRRPQGRRCDIGAFEAERR